MKNPLENIIGKKSTQNKIYKVSRNKHFKSIKLK